MIFASQNRFKNELKFVEVHQDGTRALPLIIFYDFSIKKTTVLLCSGLEFRNMFLFAEFICNTYVDNKVVDSLMHIIIIMNVSQYYCSKLK